MTDRAWSAEHERQYLHLRGGLLERGLPESLADEIAARAVHRLWSRQVEPADAKDRPLDNEAASAESTPIAAAARDGLRAPRAAGHPEETLSRHHVRGIGYP